MKEDDTESFNVDAIIERLLAVNNKNVGTMVTLDLDEVITIINHAYSIISS